MPAAHVDIAEPLARYLSERWAAAVEIDHIEQIPGGASRETYRLKLRVGAEPRGLSWAGIQRLEEVLNDELGTGHLKVYVVAVPMPRDELLPTLLAGRADIAMANLTITPERRETVDFSDPFVKDVRELVVTGPTHSLSRRLSRVCGVRPRRQRRR